MTTEREWDDVVEMDLASVASLSADMAGRVVAVDDLLSSEVFHFESFGYQRAAASVDCSAFCFGSSPAVVIGIPCEDCGVAWMCDRCVAEVADQASRRWLLIAVRLELLDADAARFGFFD